MINYENLLNQTVQWQDLIDLSPRCTSAVKIHLHLISPLITGDSHWYLRDIWAADPRSLCGSTGRHQLWAHPGRPLWSRQQKRLRQKASSAFHLRDTEEAKFPLLKRKANKSNFYKSRLDSFLDSGVEIGDLTREVFGLIMTLVQEADVLQQSAHFSHHLFFRQTLQTAIKPHMLLHCESERQREKKN